MEDQFPGMWQRWFINQCVAAGWNAEWDEGFKLYGKTKHTDWSEARKRLLEVRVGDRIIVALKNNRVGRIGTVTGLAIEDDQWDPLVPISAQWPQGEMGRRILVRWDLTVGPQDRDMVIHLPEDVRFNAYEIRKTICEVRSKNEDRFVAAMKDPANWVGLQTRFKYEAALQSYIYTFPHHLEDGLMTHPDLKVREKVFRDKTRLDVLLIDRYENAVVVECKRDGPSVSAIAQIRHYMELLQKETKRSARGILVHGGSKNLTNDVRRAAAADPPIQIVRYDLNVDFDICQ